MWECELSTIDTAILIAGVLTARHYFTLENEEEEELQGIWEIYSMSGWIGTGRETERIHLHMAGHPKQDSIIKDGIMVTAKRIYFISLPSDLPPIRSARRDTRNGSLLLNGKKSTTSGIYMQARFSFIKCLSYGLISGAFMITAIQNMV